MTPGLDMAHPEQPAASMDSDTMTMMATPTTLTSPSSEDATVLDSSSDEAESSKPLIEGSRVGNYILQKKLGEGAMGVVFGAFDTKLDRKVAIKLLKRQADHKARRRFLREAQAMARLSHPNVAQVHDIDEFAGLAFIVMEYVRGVTLADWLKQQPRTRAEIIQAFSAAGTGLEAAHRRGLVHRDFKPANVMVNEDERVLVMDFGLARESGRDSSSTHNLRAGALLDQMTTAGKIMGTPVYMAPEQFDGLEIDARADQFSFCVALWEALYGERPFKAQTMLQLVCAIKRAEFHIPEDQQGVPTWQRDVLLRGLANEPAQRWLTMEALLEALHTEPEPEAKTRWPLWIGLSVVGVAVVGALVWRLLQA